ncbi:hypothetical protein KIPB_005447 [Kipferlia bialata]|uniref:RRM domain-containing protein n=1 Tax=Kipferlia bialata TaxID=797122 RepID=A0A9K3GJ23_9EUKA|nr:hypothetical protein KIPB_005447 [Kipferlia bialata]|eukprot:g5447.t1
MQPGLPGAPQPEITSVVSTGPTSKSVSIPRPVQAAPPVASHVPGTSEAPQAIDGPSDESKPLEYIPGTGPAPQPTVPVQNIPGTGSYAQPMMPQGDMMPGMSSQEQAYESQRLRNISMPQRHFVPGQAAPMGGVGPASLPGASIPGAMPVGVPAAKRIPPVDVSVLMREVMVDVCKRDTTDPEGRDWRLLLTGFPRSLPTDLLGKFCNAFGTMKRLDVLGAVAAVSYDSCDGLLRCYRVLPQLPALSPGTTAIKCQIPQSQEERVLTHLTTEIRRNNPSSTGTPALSDTPSAKAERDDKLLVEQMSLMCMRYQASADAMAKENQWKAKEKARAARERKERGEEESEEEKAPEGEEGGDVPMDQKEGEGEGEGAEEDGAKEKEELFDMAIASTKKENYALPVFNPAAARGDDEDGEGHGQGLNMGVMQAVHLFKQRGTPALMTHALVCTPDRGSDDRGRHDAGADRAADRYERDRDRARDHRRSYR